ncbi:MAG: hypothetical protein GYB36_04505 [Alphaproteobacteria bacterium]|nr:hypothetical protein [Alphaproteobacteria bacterium]
MSRIVLPALIMLGDQGNELGSDPRELAKIHFTQKPIGIVDDARAARRPSRFACNFTNDIGRVLDKDFILIAHGRNLPVAIEFDNMLYADARIPSAQCGMDPIPASWK